MSKIIVSLSEDLLKVVDTHCEKFKYSRSEFVRYAIREVMQRYFGGWDFDKHEHTDKNKQTN